MKILTKYDVGIVGIILFLALATYCIMGFKAAQNVPNTVEIMVDGELYASYNLAEITQPKLVEIKTSYGRNVLKISSDGAEMIAADCKDSLDVRCGKITNEGQIIICVPNRVAVTLVGKGYGKVDKVTY